MLQIGQWVSYKRVAAFIVQIDYVGHRYLIHAPSVSNKEYWIPGHLLKPNDEVQLTDDDIEELKVVAVNSGDFDWYRELLGHTA